MRARIHCCMKVGKRKYQLYIDCEMDFTDIIVKDNKFVSIYCHYSSVNEKISHKDYKKAFDVSQDGDYHILITFIKNPSQLRVVSQYNLYGGPNWQIYIEGV